MPDEDGPEANAGGDSKDAELQEEEEKFQQETEQIERAIGTIEKATFEVKALYQQSLDSPDNDTSDREKAEEICDNTAEQSQGLRKRLRALGEENRAFKANFPGRVGALKLRVTQHQALARRFMGAMQEWEDTNDSHRNATKVALENKMRELRPDASEEDVQKAVRDADETFLMQSQERGRANAAIEDLRSRTKDIKRLEESIVALHQLFVDMQIMVEAQGELLNEVEYEIGETKGQTENAHAELVQARAHQKSARKKMCCIVMLVTIIVLVVVIGLIVKYAPQWIQAAQDKVEETIGFPIGNSTTVPPAAAPPAAAPPAANSTVAGRKAQNLNVTQLVQMLKDNNLIKT